MADVNYEALSNGLSSLLKLQNNPLAIHFCMEKLADVPAFEGEMPEPTADGRTGTVPAGCVFWMKAQDKTFSTVAKDHANCSVGSVTHGFKNLEEAARGMDVAAMLEAKWVTVDIMPQIPTIKQRPNYVIYGPLKDATVKPDVVFLRVNAKQAMILHDAISDLCFEGKPQCHIIPIAKEQNQVAISVGCMLSRVRTGMPNTEMTCAIPGKRLVEVVEKLKNTCKADNAVATYASEDTHRFAGGVVDG